MFCSSSKQHINLSEVYFLIADFLKRSSQCNPGIVDQLVDEMVGIVY